MLQTLKKKKSSENSAEQILRRRVHILFVLYLLDEAPRCVHKNALPLARHLAKCGKNDLFILAWARLKIHQIMRIASQNISNLLLESQSKVSLARFELRQIWPGNAYPFRQFSLRHAHRLAEVADCRSHVRSLL